MSRGYARLCTWGREAVEADRGGCGGPQTRDIGSACASVEVDRGGSSGAQARDIGSTDASVEVDR